METNTTYKEPLFFLQQMPNGHCEADTEVIRDCLDFMEWKDKDSAIPYITAKCVSTGLAVATVAEYPRDLIVPVGTLEFVNELFRVHYEHEPVKAINIPSELQRPEWLRRQIDPERPLNESIFADMQATELFIKPARYAKQFEAMTVTPKTLQSVIREIDGATCFASTMTPFPIASEWRVFVYRGRIVGIRPYDLTKWQMPKKEQVEEMVRAYTQAPPAYTLDVAVLRNGETVILEVHNFISCGLYGFENHALLPKMLVAGIEYELKGG